MLSNFEPPKTIKELRSDWQCIPRVGGVYMVVYRGPNRPTFIENGSGGFFRRRNPNVSVEKLEAKWVDFKRDEDKIIYIGKSNRNNTLRRRVRLYIRFGTGGAVAHLGGRYVWQIANCADFDIYWKECDDSEREESHMISEFKELHQGRLPFANLISGRRSD